MKPSPNRRRARGMTLIELLIALSLSVMLVGVAAFVFTQSQQIFTRVGGRLDTAQGFRLAAQMLQNDAARMESPRDLPAITKAPGTVPWLCIIPGNAASLDLHTDQIAFVTHANVSVLDAVGSSNPPAVADHLVYVTYKLDDVATGGNSDHGLIRQLDLLVVQNDGSLKVDNSLLPNNNPPPSTGAQTSLTMQIAPSARGLAFRYVDPTSLQLTAANAASGAGTAFYTGSSPNCVSTPPSAIEISIFAPEKLNDTSGSKLSVTRVIEVLAPH